MAESLARLLQNAKKLAAVMRCTDKKCLEITGVALRAIYSGQINTFPYGKPIEPSRPTLKAVGQVHYE